MQSDSQSQEPHLDLLSKWLVNFNINKCRIMHIDRKSKAKYYLEKDNKRWEVAASEVERNLVIWVSNDLKWETQCKKAAAQTIYVLGMIRRIFPFVDVDGHPSWTISTCHLPA